MRRFWLYVGVFVFLLGSGWSQPARLADDARLQGRITVWLKMEPLREALRTVSRQVGVPLQGVDSIAQEKVCIFVEKRPAHEILEQLAQLLRYEWHKAPDGGYILRVPDNTRLEEKQAQNQLRAQRLQALREVQRLAREIAQMTPEQRVQEAKRLAQRRQELNHTEQVRLQILEKFIPTATIEDIDLSNSWLPPTYSRFSGVYAYLCLAALPERALNALLDSEWVGLSTKPPQGIYPFPNVLLPEDMRDHIHGMRISLGEDGTIIHQAKYELVNPNNPEFVGMWLRVSPLSGVVKYLLVSYPKIVWGTLDENGVVQPLSEPSYTKRDASSYFLLPLKALMPSTPLVEYWESWASEAAALRAAIPERAAPAPEHPMPTPTRYRINDAIGYRHTTADALEWLAWATQRPILSDAYRTASIAPVLQPNLPPHRLLEELSGHLWLRVDESGYLLARHQRYWELRLYELPESGLRPLEQKAEQGDLDLWDYVELAGQLHSLQVDYLIQTHGYLAAPLVHFPLEPLIACMPALRFLASLSADQRKMLDNGAALVWSQLTRTQQMRYVEALRVDFPPAALLFSEPPPASDSSTPPLLHNLITSLTAYLLNNLDTKALEQRLATPPSESYVQLQRAAPRLLPTLEISNGVYFEHFALYDRPDGDAETKAQAIQQMYRALEENPDGRMVALRLRGYLIEFFAADGKYARYAFVLPREEPFTLPPRPPETRSNPEP
ncbi:MAG: hypothetical protein ACK4P5_07925 [Fimbriimonadales bacterium]